MTRKELFIRVSTFIVMVAVLINAPALFGEPLYHGIMFAIGSWQIGAWCATLGNYLVRKYG